MRKGGVGLLKREIKTPYGFEYSHSVDTNSSEKLSIRHCHDAYEIIFVASGSGRFVVEGAEFALKARTMALIRPFEYHYVEIDENSVYERYVIHFSLDCVHPTPAGHEFIARKWLECCNEIILKP